MGVQVSEQPMITFAAHQVRAGLAGASEDFEQMLGLLVRATAGDGSLVFANPGDWGIDVLVGDLRGQVTVWQAKYFVRGVARSQRGQISASFDSALRAAAAYGYTLERWVLCIPASMDGPTLQWWQGWKTEREQASGARIELWDETRLRELLLRPEAADVRRHYYNPYRHDGQAGTSKAVASPYRGLSAFGEQDAGLFFGRDIATAQVLEVMSARLDGAGLVVVSGVSGAGKSSLLRAGVLPRLRKSGFQGAAEAASWPCVVFTPGRRPLEELAARIAPLARADASIVRERLAANPAGFALTARQAALAVPDEPAGALPPGPGQQRVLLVVDQCEQLYTLCEVAAEREAFLTALHAAATGHDTGQGPAALVVLVVRADFEAQLADHPQLITAVQHRYLLTAMTERQLRLAVTQPAAAVGSRVEDDLVQVLLDEVRTRSARPSPAGQPAGTAGAGVLPLLSYALDQAWRTRTGHALTLADYERTGGIEGAVAASAQRAYERLTPAQREAARQVFTRLTATSADGTDTAARVAPSDLTAANNPAGTYDVEAVLEEFAAARLLILDADAVEISHEALLTAWPLLRDTWLADTHAGRIIRTRLHAAAAEWIRASRDPAYLYSGSRLQAATDAAARIGADTRHAPLSQAEKAFLDASQHADQRRARRRQGITAGLLALVVGLAAVAVTAVHASQVARSDSQVLARQRDIAISGQLADDSESTGNANATASQLESIAAWGLSRSAQASYAMLAAAARPEVATLTASTGQINSIAFGPHGNTLATAGDNGPVRLWNTATGQQIGKPFGSDTDGATSVAFSPDGKILATSGGTDGLVRLWNTATGQQIGKPFGSDTDGTDSVAFSPDGKTLATAGFDNSVRLWNTATGQQIGKPLTRSSKPVNSVAFSPDGKILAAGGDDGVVRLWDAATRRLVGRPLPTGQYAISSVAFSPDDKLLATAGNDGAVRLWDAATGQQIGKPIVNNVSGILTSVAFSPDGKLLATGSFDDTARLWDVATGQQIGGPLVGNPLAVATNVVDAVAFSPDGRLLATANVDGTVRLWNVIGATGHQIRSLRTAHPYGYTWVAFGPDGKILATSGATDGLVRLWNTATGQQIGKHLAADFVESVAFSPDGRILATGSPDGTARLWDVATGRQIGGPLAGDIAKVNGGVDSVAFSPDGRILATGGDNGTARLWNVATGQQIGKPIIAVTFNPVSSVAFSPDGSTLATGIGGGPSSGVRLWDVATHRPIGNPLSRASNGVNSVAFSPDGRIVAVGGVDDAVRLWDVATGQQIGGPLTGNPLSSDASNGVDSVAFSPDGRILATGGDNGTVRLWDVATGQQIGGPLTGNPLTGDTGAIMSVAFSPDGKILATGSIDGTARLWDVSYLVDVVGHLCSQVGGSLTRAEWSKYVPAGPAYRNVC
jgi:WD40 repeat protein